MALTTWSIAVQFVTVRGVNVFWSLTSYLRRRQLFLLSTHDAKDRTLNSISILVPSVDVRGSVGVQEIAAKGKTWLHNISIMGIYSEKCFFFLQTSMSVCCLASVRMPYVSTPKEVTGVRVNLASCWTLLGVTVSVGIPLTKSNSQSGVLFTQKKKGLTDCVYSLVSGQSCV